MDVLSTVEKTLRVIEFLARKEEAGISEISTHLQLAPSTTHRIVATLCSHGYITRNGVTRRYRLGMKFFQLGSTVVGRFGVRESALGNMETLADASGETVNLGVLVRSDVYYLEKILNNDPIRVELQVGHAVPAHCTALGKAIMAFLPSARLNDILSAGRLVERTSRSITDPDTLRRELEVTRKRGYALDNGELIEGISCLAAPVLVSDNCAIAAISIAGPSSRITRDFIREHVSQVREAAEKTSREIRRLGISSARL